MEEMSFLEREAPFSRYHEVVTPSDASQDALKGVRPITPSSVGRWRNHLPRVAGQLKRHGSITNDLIEFGYESDNSWLSELDGVELDLSESALPESFSEEDIKDKLRGRYREAVKAMVRLAGLDPSKVKKWIPAQI